VLVVSCGYYINIAGQNSTSRNKPKSTKMLVNSNDIQDYADINCKGDSRSLCLILFSRLRWNGLMMAGRILKICWGTQRRFSFRNIVCHRIL
jgi:hypothetical protein